MGDRADGSDHGHSPAGRPDRSATRRGRGTQPGRGSRLRELEFGRGSALERTLLETTVGQGSEGESPALNDRALDKSGWCSAVAGGRAFLLGSGVRPCECYAACALLCGVALTRWSDPPAAIAAQAAAAALRAPVTTLLRVSTACWETLGLGLAGYVDRMSQPTVRSRPMRANGLGRASRPNEPLCGPEPRQSTAFSDTSRHRSAAYAQIRRHIACLGGSVRHWPILVWATFQSAGAGLASRSGRDSRFVLTGLSRSA